jgi:hypothetical protein
MKGITALIVVLLSAAVILRRQVAAYRLYDVLWAEDGRIFLMQALESGGFDVLLEPYNGYLSIVPRLIGALAAVAPLEYAALIMAGASALIVGMVTLFVFQTSAALYDSLGSRIALAASVVLLPLGGEILANAANLHWYLMLAAFFALAFESGRRVEIAAAVAILLAATLSDPLTAVLAPLAFFPQRKWTRGRLIKVVAFGIGLAAQFVSYVTSQGIDGIHATAAFDLPGLFAVRLAGGLVLGDVLLGPAWALFGWEIFIVASLALIGGIALGLRALPSRSRALGLMAIASAISYFLLPFIIRGTGELPPEVGQALSLGTGRYFVLPAWLLASVAFAVFSRWRSASGFGRVALSVAIMWGVAVVLLNLAINPRPVGPSWRQEIGIAVGECERGALATVRVPIAPQAGPADASPWYVDVACNLLT